MNKKNLYIFGTGDHARKVFYSATLAGFTTTAFIDENKKAQSPIPNIPIFNSDKLNMATDNTTLFIAIGNPQTRQRLLEFYKNSGWNMINIIHPSSNISPDVILENGIFIGAGSIIESNSYIGNGSIIDIGVIIDHDCHIPAYSHLRAGEICQPRTHWENKVNH